MTSKEVRETEKREDSLSRNAEPLTEQATERTAQEEATRRILAERQIKGIGSVVTTPGQESFQIVDAKEQIPDLSTSGTAKALVAQASFKEAERPGDQSDKSPREKTEKDDTLDEKEKAKAVKDLEDTILNGDKPGALSKLKDKLAELYQANPRDALDVLERLRERLAGKGITVEIAGDFIASGLFLISDGTNKFQTSINPYLDRSITRWNEQEEGRGLKGIAESAREQKTVQTKSLIEDLQQQIDFLSNPKPELIKKLGYDPRPPEPQRSEELAKKVQELADAYVKRGQPQEAIKVLERFERAFEKRMDSAHAADMAEKLAQIHESSSDQEKAQLWYDKAAEQLAAYKQKLEASGKDAEAREVERRIEALDRKRGKGGEEKGEEKPARPSTPKKGVVTSDDLG